MDDKKLKTTKFFSWTLMKQNIKSNLVLMIVVVLIMCLMSVAINYASSLMGTGSSGEEVEDAQTTFYSYLYILASYNEMAGTELSYEDFMNTDDKTAYETAFNFANSSSDELNLNVEAFAGICYLGSSFANLSRKSMAFGGGLTVWFFLASLIGMFGMEDMVNVGMGVEELGVFNNTTIITLFDVNSISTIGTGSVDYSFVWKLGILVAIALVCYIAGSIKFKKKDLPL